MKRQPEGIPTGGQFATDRRAEPDGSLAAAPSSAPPGCQDYPGTWGPVDEADQQEYTSPAGTVLLVTGGEDPEVEHDPALTEDAFQFYPEEGDEQGLRDALNEALNRVAIQKATEKVMSYSGDIYERMGTDATWDQGPDKDRSLKTVKITIRDLERDRYLELDHNYSTGQTSVTDALDGELELSDSSAERHAILSDLVLDPGNNRGEAHEDVFNDIHAEFGDQDERFGLD